MHGQLTMGQDLEKAESCLPSAQSPAQLVIFGCRYERSAVEISWLSKIMCNCYLTS